jgi:hypothetical protein
VIKRTAINRCFCILIVYESQTSEIDCRVSQSFLSSLSVSLRACRICDGINLLASSCLRETPGASLLPIFRHMLKWWPKSKRSIQFFILCAFVPPPPHVPSLRFAFQSHIGLG